MLFERAQQIVSSPDKIEVRYKNNPVWIESVNNDRATARVKLLGSNETQDVPVLDLIEIGVTK